MHTIRFLRALHVFGRQSALVLLFFVIILFAGWVVHDDFGVSADEPAMLRYGHDVLQHLFAGGSLPLAVDWQFHGPVWQMFLAPAQNVAGATDGADIWFLRHWLSFLLFVCGILAFYGIAKEMVGDRRWALLGVCSL
jgi:hypothetical protein